MYDIVLINPPIHSTETFIPKGIWYLHQILKEGGYNSELLDLEAELHLGTFSLDPTFIKQATEFFREYPAKVFGFSVWNVSYPWAAQLATSLKEMYPECKIVVGGPLATIFKERILEENSTVDVVAIREGEKIIIPLVQALLSNNENVLSGVKNIFYRARDNTIHSTPETPLLEDLDSLPFLKFDRPYYYRSRFFNLEVGRGCAYRCTFCCSSYIWLRKPRFMSAKRITKLAQYYWTEMKEENVEEPIIHFEHDNFLFNKELVKEILRIKKEKGYSFLYGFAGRIDLLDEEIIDMMAETNCRYIYVGIESGSERIQRQIKKRINLTKVLPAIRRLRDRGIQVAANFIVGFPEETMTDLVMTLELMARLSWLGVAVKANLLHPEPHTPIAASAGPDDYVLIKTSPFYRELRQCGIEPECFPRELVNHLYALKNDNFDINIMDRFLNFYLHLLYFFPLSARILLELNRFSFMKLYDRFRSRPSSSPEEAASPGYVFSFLMDITHLLEIGSSSVISKTIRYEAFHARKTLGLPTTSKDNINAEESEQLYRRVASNPHLLLEQNDE